MGMGPGLGVGRRREVVSGREKSRGGDVFRVSGEIEQYLGEALNVYSFLRTLSLPLQLSPFAAETFLRSLLSSPVSNNLQDEVHLALIRTCAAEINLCPWYILDWCLLDRVSWPAFLLPLLQGWLEHAHDLEAQKAKSAEVSGAADNASPGSAAVSENVTMRTLSAELPELTEACEVLKRGMQRTKGNYSLLAETDKLQIIQCLITLLLTSGLLADSLELRAKLDIPPASTEDPIPLFDKGDDGYPEACIVCMEMGDLICCDLCPCTYHQKCLNAPASTFDGVWECFECATSDPLRSRGRQQLHSLKDQTSLLVVGRYVLQKKRNETWRLLERKEVGVLLKGCQLLTQWPWKEYVAAVSKYPTVQQQDASALTPAPIPNRTKRGRDDTLDERDKSPVATNSTTTTPAVGAATSILTPEQICETKYLDLNALPRNLQPALYINRYKTCQTSPYLYTIKHALAQFRCRDLIAVDVEWPARASAQPVLKSLLLGLEALFFRLGPLCGKKLWDDPLQPKGFLLSLCAANSLSEAKRLLLEIATSIHVSLFSPEWFQSFIELKYLSMGNLGAGALDAPTKAGRLVAPRKPPLRIHKFVRVDNLLQVALTKESFDSSRIRGGGKKGQSGAQEDEPAVDLDDEEDHDDEDEKGDHDDEALRMVFRRRVEMREEPDGPCLRRFATSAGAARRLNLYPERKITKCARFNEEATNVEDRVTAFGFYWYYVTENGQADPTPMADIESLIKLSRTRYSMKSRELKDKRSSMCKSIDARETSNGPILKRFDSGIDVARFLGISQVGVSACARGNEQRAMDSRGKFAGIYWVFSSQATDEEGVQDVDMELLQSIVDGSRAPVEVEMETDDVGLMSMPTISKNKYGADFLVGRVFMEPNELPYTSSKLIKKLARVGGRALLPHVAYALNTPINDVSAPLAPFAWHWYQRVLLCETQEELVIQFRYLEQALRLDELDKLPSPEQVITGAEETGMSLFEQPFDFSGDIAACISTHKVDRAIEKGGPPSGYAIWLEIAANALHSVAGPAPAPSKYHLISPTISASSSAHGNDEDGCDDGGSKLEFVDSAHVLPRALADYYHREWLRLLMEKLPVVKEEPRAAPKTPMEQLAEFGDSVLVITQGSTIEGGNLYLYKDQIDGINAERAKTVKALSEMLNISDAAGSAGGGGGSAGGGGGGSSHLFFATTLMTGKSDQIILQIVEDLVSRVKDAAISTARAEALRNSDKGNCAVSSSLNSEATKLASLAPFTRQVPTLEGPGRTLHNFFLHPVYRNRKAFACVSVAPHESGLRLMTAVEAKVLDRKKCSLVRPVEGLYVPQVGDELIYYTDGHQEYCNLYSESSRRGLLKKKNVEKLWVACRVLTIDYECRQGLVGAGDKGASMVLQLGVLGSISPDKLGNMKQFIVVYTPGHVCGEFLVTREKMLATLVRGWQVGHRFSVVYNDGNRYEGVVSSIDRDECHFPRWGGIRVIWDGSSLEDTDPVCEWELEEPFRVEAVAMEVVAESSTTGAVDCMNKKLHAIVDKFMSGTDFEAFCEDISDVLAPSYSKYIPVNMYLRLMLQRASNSFYRQPQAMLGDVRTLYINCAYYNLETSRLTLQVKPVLVEEIF